MLIKLILLTGAMFGLAIGFCIGMLVRIVLEGGLKMLLGMFIGGFIGIVLMCLLQIRRTNEQKDLKTGIINFSDWIALIIYQEIKTANKDKIEGMKDIQNMYEKFFEEELE